MAKEQPAVCSPLSGGDKKHLVANLRHVRAGGSVYKVVGQAMNN